MKLTAKSLSLLAFLFPLLALAQQHDLAYYYNQAEEAHRVKDYPKFYQMIQEAHTIHPYHQGILYQCGLAAALTGKASEAIHFLRKAILIDASFTLAGLSDFNSIKDNPEFKALLKLQADWLQPVIHSDTAVVIYERNLHTEGVAVDVEHGNYYLGSIYRRKIVRVTALGSISDFCESGVQGMTSVMGIRIDKKRNVLWATASPIRDILAYDSGVRSAVFKFELSTGRLLAKYQRPGFEKDGIWGDLIINRDGLPIISDTENNQLFILNESSGKVEPFFGFPDFRNIQGLALTEDEKYLFIADYVIGIFRVDLKNKTAKPIACSLEVSLKGIDGLAYYEGSLIAIQNGTNPLRATRYFLNKEMNEITSFEILDKKHPAFGEPTLGSISDNTFYYVANSQWNQYNHQKAKPDAQLHDIVVLKYALK